MKPTKLCRIPVPTGLSASHLCLDHKVIGIQYIILALAAVLVGMVMSVLMRLNLRGREHIDPRSCFRKAHPEES